MGLRTALWQQWPRRSQEGWAPAAVAGAQVTRLTLISKQLPQRDQQRHHAKHLANYFEQNAEGLQVSAEPAAQRVIDGVQKK